MYSSRDLERLGVSEFMRRVRRFRRIELGLTLVQMAELCDCHRDTLGGAEIGRRPLGSILAKKLEHLMTRQDLAVLVARLKADSKAKDGRSTRFQKSPSSS